MGIKLDYGLVCHFLAPFDGVPKYSTADQRGINDAPFKLPVLRDQITT
jgi:hypothetical protein